MSANQPTQKQIEGVVAELSKGPANSPTVRVIAHLAAEVRRLTEEARRSDAVKVPEPTCQNCAAKWCQFHGIPGRACSDHERLSHSPQPATWAVLTCDDCDSREGCPKRGAPCMYHLSHRDHQPSADVVVVPREEYMLLQTCESVLRGSGPVYFSGRPLDELDRFRSSTNHDPQTDRGEG